jgi:hypothetical protein
MAAAIARLMAAMPPRAITAGESVVRLFSPHLDEEEPGAAKQRHVPVEVMMVTLADFISEGIRR